ncbi:11852_t:CDS:2, partial [Funneliformis caledonium]
FLGENGSTFFKEVFRFLIFSWRHRRMDVEYARYKNELNTISRYYAKASELVCFTNCLGPIDSLSTPTTLQSVMVVVGKTVMFVDELYLMDFGNHDALIKIFERKNIEAKKKLQEEAK